MISRLLNQCFVGCLASDDTVVLPASRSLVQLPHGSYALHFLSTTLTRSSFLAIGIIMSSVCLSVCNAVHCSSHSWGRCTWPKVATACS